MRAMICDDDEIIRKGLCSVVDWSAMDVEIVGTAGDGKEGMKLLKQKNPDLLLTDIRMPQVDGLELIQEGKKQNPNLMVIVFSGYDDFEYVRRALRLGVQDYLMKPINMEELTKQVKRCVSEFQRSLRNDFEKKENLLRKYLAYEDCEESPLKEVEREYCQVLILETEQESKQIGRLSEDLRKQGVYVLLQKERRCELVILAESAVQVELIGKRCVELAENCFRKERTGFVTAVGNIGFGLRSFHRGYEEAKNALKLKYIKGYNQTLTYQEMQNYQVSHEKYGENIFDTDLIRAVKQGNLEQTESLMDQLEMKMTEMGMDSFLYMQYTVGNLYNGILKELEAIGIQAEFVFENPVNEYRRLIECETMKKAAGVLRENVRRICEYVHAQQNGAYSRSVYKALRYMREHYSDPLLGQEETSAAAGLSSGRFSTLFKTETGVTFTDYLLRLRMEKAKELMKNPNTRIYEAAQMVGYENIPYFSTAFKKYTGMSPSEYRTSQKS